jgi:hypothetical protein
MFSALRRRIHVSPTTVIASLALVFAMTGGAYAAKKYLITSTKQISPSVLKSLQGKSGPAGAAGANGAQGPAGAQGSAGVKGENGANGSNGRDGVSVTSSVEPAGANCKAGGSKFVAASGTTYACNGEKGKEGTFGGQSLPAGKSLTGVWAASGYAGHAFSPTEPEEIGVVEEAVSFPLPVSPTLTGVEYIGVEEGEGEANEKLPELEVNGKVIKVCTGNHEKPVAAEGFLCVFGENELNLNTKPTVNSTSVSETTPGFTMLAFIAAKGRGVMQGTWVVTGH